MFDGFRGYGFDAAEAQALRGAGIKNADALWARAAQKPDAPLEQLAADTGIGVVRLREALGAGAHRGVPAARPGPLSRHWLDALVLLGALLVLALVTREPPKPRQAAFAQLRAPVAAFQVLGDADARDTSAVAPKGALSADAVQGRVALRSMRPGEPVTEADLGPRMAPDALAGRAVLALSTTPERAPMLPRAGARVGIVLSPRAPGAGAGAVLRDVLVLSATQTDSALRFVVALPEADVAAVSALAGISDLHVLATPPR